MYGFSGTSDGFELKEQCFNNQGGSSFLIELK